MARALVQSLIAQLEAAVGPPVRLELLEQAGPRATYRARGASRTAIAEVYADGGGTASAERIAALSGGPPAPRVPEVWDATDTVVVLSDIAGRPLRAAALAGDELACERAGFALGRWHWSWRYRIPAVLEPRTLAQELDVLRAHAREAPEPLAAAALFGVRAIEADDEWKAVTVVHGGLSEETLVLDGDVGLVKLDGVAAGPPELDVGSLCGHLEFLARRYGRDLDGVQRAFVNGYLATGAPLDLHVVLTCRGLALLRLGCVHRDVDLATAREGSAWPPPQASVPERLVGARYRYA